MAYPYELLQFQLVDWNPIPYVSYWVIRDKSFTTAESGINMYHWLSYQISVDLVALICWVWFFFCLHLNVSEDFTIYLGIWQWQ